MYRQKSLSLTSVSQPVILVWKPAWHIKEITNFVKEKAGLLLVGVQRCKRETNKKISLTQSSKAWVTAWGAAGGGGGVDDKILIESDQEGQD